MDNNSLTSVIGSMHYGLQLSYLYGGPRVVPVDGDNFPSLSVAHHAVGSVTIRQVERTFVTRLEQTTKTTVIDFSV